MADTMAEFSDLTKTLYKTTAWYTCSNKYHVDIYDSGVAHYSTWSTEEGASAGKTGVTREELEQLKHDAVNCVNESLFKKLQQVEQAGTMGCYTCKRTRYDFVEALIRRIRRLLKLHTTAAS